MKTQVIGSTGQLVRDFQYLFSGHNRYKIQTYFGPVDGKFGPQTGEAAKKMKWLIGYPSEDIKPTAGLILYRYLIPKSSNGVSRPLSFVLRARQRQDNLSDGHSYPSSVRGSLIGFPFQGTHDPAFNRAHGTDNWESERAIDIALPYGTELIACFSGEITNQFGPLSSSDPRLLGLRMHIKGDHDEAYYAHMSKFNPGIHALGKVINGQAIGLSGSANGVNHLHFALKNANPLDFIRRL